MRIDDKSCCWRVVSERALDAPAAAEASPAAGAPPEPDAATLSEPAVGAASEPGDWSSRKVPELKDELRARGLKVGGKKAELVARLAEACAAN